MTETSTGAAALADLDRRLAKVGGQVEGIRGMVASRRPCSQVLDQLAAARAALDAVAARLVVEEIRDAVDETTAADELCEAVTRLARR